MWRNYFTVGIRALGKSRTYAFINIFGLAIGMAACLLILLYVRYETSYDTWFPGAEHVYQMQSVLTDPDSGEVQPLQQAPYQARLALEKDFPQIEKISFLFFGSRTMLERGQAISRDITWVEPAFLDLYPIHLIHGDRRTALSDPHNLLLSRSEAIARFGTDDVVGRTLTFAAADAEEFDRITGVFEDLPKNSNLNFYMLGAVQPETMGENLRTNWGAYSGQILIRFRPGTDVKGIEAQLPAWATRNVPLQTVNGRSTRQTDNVKFSFVPVPEIHLGPAGGNDRGTITTFAIVALLILAMACANFTNLATARASQRAREVSLRKVLGANRSQLVIQFLAESVMVAALAVLLALALTEVALPWLRRFLDSDMQLTYFGRGGVLLPAVALTLVVGLVGGLYPAFYLTRFQPAQVLRANRSATEAGGSGRLRNILVVGQFAISIGLIICTGIIYAQTIYARTVNPGFERSGLLQVRNMDKKRVKPLVRTLENEIGRTDGVESVALTSIGINTGTRNNTSIVPYGGGKDISVQNYTVAPGFFHTMGIPLLAGRFLSETRAMDDITEPEGADEDAYSASIVGRGMNIVMNQSAAKRIGFARPADAIGKQVKFAVVKLEAGMVPATIVGVVGDTRFNSVREPAGDIVYFRNDKYLDTLEVRFRASDPIALKNRIEATWKRIAPQVPFDAEFADSLTADLYKQDVARGQIFAAFALLAVLVGCLGLFGLASFTAERRTKEIGIRKVLGARTRDIVQLLVWQFNRPVLLANLIAWPLAWWAMRSWLNGFDARIALGPAPFLFAALLALVIATLTISGHAMKVARAKPIHALRYE